MSEDWRRHPFELVPGDPRFTFPAAEGSHPDCESDTWYLAGKLGSAGGRRFAFLVIVNENRPGLGPIVADFYTFALFDLDSGAYGTFTDYDMPPANMKPGARPKLTAADGHLELTYDSAAGRAHWRTRRDGGGDLVPFSYDVDLVGIDADGESMRLELAVSPTRAPVPLGAATRGGVIECFGQAETFSYLQTGMHMTGTLSWGGTHESVTGTAGHVDRQWFPLMANGGGAGGDVRARAHEWRTINLDNGVDLSVWHQFDRTDHNAPQPFSGATTSSPEGGAAPAYADDVVVTVSSYVKWPESVLTLVPPPTPARYLPDRHRLTSETLGLDLTGEPLVSAPAHALPLEYMEGPYLYRGTWRGEPVSGFAIYERSLALYRDWELVDVLATMVGEQAVADVRALVAAGDRDAALGRLDGVVVDEESAALVADLAAAIRLGQR